MAPIAPHHRTRGMVAPQNPYWCGSRIMMEYDTDVRCPQSPQHWAGAHITGRVRKVDARPFSWTRELVKYDDFKSRFVLPRVCWGLRSFLRDGVARSLRIPVTVLVCSDTPARQTRFESDLTPVTCLFTFCVSASALWYKVLCRLCTQTDNVSRQPCHRRGQIRMCRSA